MPPENDDLRSALEEAFNEHEGGEPTPSPETGGPAENAAEPVRTAAPTERSEPAGDAPKSTEPAPTSGEVKTTDGAAAPKEAAAPSITAPESWKPQARDAWTKVPTEAQQEILRREREIVMTLQNTAGARKMAEAFHQAISPFEMMIQAEGSDPVSATRELFGQAAILRIGTPAQKAQLVAQVVKRFGVNIQALDAALVGDQVPDEESKIAQIIQQQLAPVREFMTSIEGVKQNRARQVDSTIDGEIQQFSQDKTNEFFFDVKDDMADLMEMAARNGRSLTLKQAYDRALKLNENVAATIAQRQQQSVAKARAAGSSLPSRGAPPSGGSSQGDSLHADLTAAFERLASQ